MDYKLVYKFLNLIGSPEKVGGAVIKCYLLHVSRIITSTIKDYRGTVIVVSHDQSFMDGIGVSRYIEGIICGNIESSEVNLRRTMCNPTVK